MNRRLMLTAAAGAAPALLLAAGRPAAAQSAPTIGPSTHRTMTLLLGSLSLQTSALAIQRARNPRVREFAGFERDEQLTIAQVLTDTPNPAPAPLDDKSTAMLQQLAATPEAQFDAQYVAAQIQGHQQLLQVQQAYLNDVRTMVGDEAHIAIMARAVISMHLTMLAELQQTLGA